MKELRIMLMIVLTLLAIAFLAGCSGEQFDESKHCTQNEIDADDTMIIDSKDCVFDDTKIRLGKVTLNTESEFWINLVKTMMEKTVAESKKDYKPADNITYTHIEVYYKSGALMSEYEVGDKPGWYK